MKVYPFFLAQLVLPLADRVIGTEYSCFLKLFSRLEGYRKEQIVEWQNQQLALLMRHVFKNIPFYRDFMTKNGISPEDIRSQEDLRLLPVLDKKIIKDQFSQFIPDNLKDLKYIISATGGSTGEPLTYYLSKQAQSAIWAKRILLLKRYGFETGEPYLAMGSSSIVSEGKSSAISNSFHRLTRMIPLNAANMDEKKCRMAVDLLRKNRIRLIYGYASSIYLLARYVLDAGIELGVDICMTTSEKLTEQYEETIRKAFSCEVIDAYGSRDGGICSFRCRQGRFHMIETCLFGIRDESPSTGSIISTNLVNYAMPFINYAVGDVITTFNSKCECGSGSFSFENVVGRDSQVMILGNGRTITGPAFTVLFSKLPVKCYQIAKTGELLIEVRIQPDDGYSEKTERVILESLQVQTGKDCAVAFNYNYQFAPLRNGKRDYFITG